MSRLPRLKGKELIRALENAGFVVDRSRGSHFRLKHPDGRATSVPVHAGEIIGPGFVSGDTSGRRHICRGISKIVIGK